jgi:hypothetical protein
MGIISPSFDKLHRAAGKALDTVMKTSGKETDPDLMLYESLQKHHFDAMVQRYGVEPTVRYITMMEARRLKRGKHG